MGLCDQGVDKGCLGVVAGSHTEECNAAFRKDPEAAMLKYSPLQGANGSALPRCWYAYRAASPMLIDARTWHRALDNTSESRSWRVITWFIYHWQE